ncbi:hypothetical protein Micbo1qcDRAFT_209056 [Microdochium bolleyi]|uniref:Fungal lipase-type domain-containing protein n=1 Tax=Microdochium bolleyi TaxID=196109 RepID=A0A136IN65_9PEZI|nr:hypothetical protein Micbo1qcDRAFT_209056 [Microdochium bolleyi]
MSLPPHFDYNDAQQVYCLSAASNAVGSMSATQADLQSAMETSLREKLPQISGNWEVSWGPCVYSRYPAWDFPPENVCFAAVSHPQKRVVVAVAGTAPPAGSDWLDDVNIYESVDLSEWFGQWDTMIGVPPPSEEWWVSSGDMVCSDGTANGVFNILNNAPPSTAHDSGVLLWQYLQDLPSDYTLIMTGHSMGGAIVPVLALGLSNARMVAPGSFYTMTSAGPGVGNEAFVGAYKQAFPVKQHGSPPNYATLNSDLFNPNDIVPQAWSTDAADDRTLDNIPYAIYTKARVPGDFGAIWDTIWSAVKAAKAIAEWSFVDYRTIPGTPFTKIPPFQQPITTVDEAAQSVKDQHTKYYWRYIGIDKFEDEFEKHVGAQPGVSKPKIILGSTRQSLRELKKKERGAVEKSEPSKQ